MAQYDGSIRINTEITAKQAEKELKSLESSISKTADKIASLRSKMNALKDVKIPTDEYKEIQNQIENTKKKIDDLQARQEKFLATGGKDSSPTYKRMQYDIDELKASLPYLKDELQELVESGKAFTLGSDTEKYVQMSAQMQKINQQMTSDMQRQSELKSQIREREERLAQLKENAVVGNQRIVEVMERRKQLAQEIKDLEAAGVTQGYIDYDRRKQEIASLDQAIKEHSNNVNSTKNSYKGLKESIKNALSLAKKGFKDIPIAAAKKGIKGLKAAFQGLGSIGKKSLSFIGSGMKKITSRMLGFGKSVKQSGGMLSTFGSRFKSLALSLLIFNQITKAFNVMVSGIKEGFSNLYNENSALKGQVDGLRASLLTMKNALAGAFAPIVQIAIPYIQQFVSWLTSAISAVGQFIAALTGRKTYIKAVQQTAGAFEDTAGAANDAKEAVEGYLNPLDEVNKYSDGKDNGAGAGGGGGAGGAGQMFEEVPISSKFKDIAQWFKDMWADADFTELGALLGKKLKSALEKIPWDSIQQTAAKVGKSFATLINGFVEVPELGHTIGKSIGEAINTGIELSNNFFDNTHWDSIGKFFGEGLNGIIESIKWEDLGHNLVARFRASVITAINFLGSINFGSISKGLSEFAIGIFDSLSDLITEIEWSKLPRWIIDSISDFFKGFDYKGIFGSIGKLVGTAVVAGIDLISALGEVFADIGTKVKDFFVEKFKEAGWSEDGGFIENGKAIIEGLLNGILEGIGGIGKWIYENIFQPFIDGFKDAFGIHSPSTVMKELGKYLIQGLFEGINSLSDTIKQTWQSMKETAVTIWNNTKEGLSTTWNNIKNNAKTVFDNVKTNISNAWNNAKQNTRTAWENMKSNAITAAQNIASNVKSKYENIKSSIKSFASSAKSTWNNTWSNMKNTVSSVLGTIKNTVSSAFSWISSKVRSIGSSLKNLFSKTSSSGSSRSSYSFSRAAYSIPSPYALYPEFSKINTAPIPKLATGAVIPANKEFLAVLGDQKHGTNIEAPLDTIKQAQRESILEVLSELGLTGRSSNNNPQTIIIKQYLDGKQVAESVVKEGKVRQMATGSNMFMLGTT